jgi:hypothetical protein
MCYLINTGRGGCNSHNRANIGYRQRIINLQPVYKRLERNEKIQLSKDIVDWVKQRGGRFLKRDGKTSPWYVATDERAQIQVAQRLREDHSAAGKHAKKEKLARAIKAREAKLARANEVTKEKQARTMTARAA